MKKIEHVNHPNHYNRGGIEAIDVIEAWGLNFNLGNTVKYISRAGFKNPAKKLEDLEKARWYLQREIENMGGDTLVKAPKEPKPTLDDLQRNLFEEMLHLEMPDGKFPKPAGVVDPKKSIQSTEKLVDIYEPKEAAHSTEGVWQTAITSL